MGQTNTHLQTISSTITNFVDECGSHSQSIIKDDLINMNYDEFLKKLRELNALSRNCFDSEGMVLIFAVKKGTDSTVLWKATIQIACVKLSLDDNKVISYRLISFREFLKIYRTIQDQCNIVATSGCSEGEQQTLTISSIVPSTSESEPVESSTECCICLERKMELLLPCAHSYCKQCIEEWYEDHHTCPICREKLNSADDTWVLSEVPKAEEISEEIRSTLMDLAEDRSDNCTPS